MGATPQCFPPSMLSLGKQHWYHTSVNVDANVYKTSPPPYPPCPLLLGIHCLHMNQHSMWWSNLLLHVHAGSPNVTNLTYNGQSRTLTCTSSGGPATTVTWKRDGVVITLNATHQQTKRLVDPVASTYQTVLNIDSCVGRSDVVGTYNCTVENDRGESSETVVVLSGKIWTFVHTYCAVLIIIKLLALWLVMSMLSCRERWYWICSAFWDAWRLSFVEWIVWNIHFWMT